MKRTLGIDLGTTNSVAAYFEGGQCVTVMNSAGDRTMPSVVAWTKETGFLIGKVAKRQAAANPSNTIEAVKRKMGSDEVIVLGGEKYRPQEISAKILRKIVDDANTFIIGNQGEEPITQVVITVPAYFNVMQKEATEDAAKAAGLEVMQIINEPTAACLSYGLEKRKEGNIAIIDLGGGTFDVSIVSVDEGVFTVRSTNGDKLLGGIDFDKAVYEWVLKEFKTLHGFDLDPDPYTAGRIKQEALEAKEALSGATSVTFSLIGLANGINFTSSLSRSTFNKITKPLIDRLKQPIEMALADASLSGENIDYVALVGGSTRIPAVRELVKSIFKQEPQVDLNPDEVVARGAAIQAALLDNAPIQIAGFTDVALFDITSQTLGIDLVGGWFSRIIPRNTPIPAIIKKDGYRPVNDYQTAIDINIYQGEDDKYQNNEWLGKFTLMGIPARPSKDSNMEVTFKIDSNGVMEVTAVELNSGVKASIRIENPARMSEADISTAITRLEVQESRQAMMNDQAEKAAGESKF